MNEPDLKMHTIETYQMNWDTGKMTHWHFIEGTTVTQALSVASAHAFRDTMLKARGK